MNQSLILDAFLTTNVLCHTDSDVIEDCLDREALDDASWGWAENLQKNLIDKLKVNEVSTQLAIDVFNYFKFCDRQTLSVKILNTYPENIDWLSSPETEKAFNELISYFLSNWNTINSITPLSRPKVNKL